MQHGMANGNITIQAFDLGKTMEPIFIMGCQRSGTSALWKALCQHPNLKQRGPDDDGRPVSTMKELWFLQEFFLGRESNRHRPHAGTEIDREFKIRFAKLVDQFCKEKYAGSSERWISAHPSDSLYLGEILELFPDGRVIFLIRHPQEVVWSAVHAPWEREMKRQEFLDRAHESSKHWRRLAQICVKIIEGKFGERVLTVRQEHMISQPTVIARKVLQHLGEAFYEDVATCLGNVLNSSFLKNDERSGHIVRVREKIAKDKALCCRVVSEVGDLMGLFGYKDLSGRYDPPEQFYRGACQEVGGQTAFMSKKLGRYFQGQPSALFHLDRLLRLSKNVWSRIR